MDLTGLPSADTVMHVGYCGERKGKKQISGEGVMLVRFEHYVPEPKHSCL